MLSKLFSPSSKRRRVAPPPQSHSTQPSTTQNQEEIAEDNVIVIQGVAFTLEQGAVIQRLSQGWKKEEGVKPQDRRRPVRDDYETKGKVLIALDIAAKEGCPERQQAEAAHARLKAKNIHVSVERIRAWRRCEKEKTLRMCLDGKIGRWRIDKRRTREGREERLLVEVSSPPPEHSGEGFPFILRSTPPPRNRSSSGSHNKGRKKESG